MYLVHLNHNEVKSFLLLLHSKQSHDTERERKKHTDFFFYLFQTTKKPNSIIKISFEKMTAPQLNHTTSKRLKTPKQIQINAIIKKKKKNEQTSKQMNEQTTAEYALRVQRDVCIYVRSTYAKKKK